MRKQVCTVSALMAMSLFAGELPVVAQTAQLQPVSQIQLQSESPLPPIPPTQTSPTILPSEQTPPNQYKYELKKLTPGQKYYEFLPKPFFYSLAAETSQRLETNIFMSKNAKTSDYIFRPASTLNIGWQFKNLSQFYGQYALTKDVFAVHQYQTAPTNQSLAYGYRFPIATSAKRFNESTFHLWGDMEARELWVSSHRRFGDLIPALYSTYKAKDPNGTKPLFSGSIQLQMRSPHYFQGPTKEIDPIYTLGISKPLTKQLTLSLTESLVTNCRFRKSQGNVVESQKVNGKTKYEEVWSGKNIQPGAVQFVSTVQLSWTPMQKIRGLTTFVRVQPVWNWSSHEIRGQSGFDFRLFTGMSYSLGKPPVLRAVNKEFPPDPDIPKHTGTNGNKPYP